MTTLNRLVLLSGFVILTLVAFLYYWFSADGCSNEVSRVITSPDQQLNAVLFNRGCGATTDFNSQVSIVKADSPLPTKAGNVLIIGGHPNDNQLLIEWADNQKLLIGNLPDSRAYLKAEQLSANGIEVVIHYQDD